MQWFIDGSLSPVVSVHYLLNITITLLYCGTCGRIRAIFIVNMRETFHFFHGYVSHTSYPSCPATQPCHMARVLYWFHFTIKYMSGDSTTRCEGGGEGERRGMGERRHRRIFDRRTIQSFMQRKTYDSPRCECGHVCRFCRSTQTWRCTWCDGEYTTEELNTPAQDINSLSIFNRQPQPEGAQVATSQTNTFSLREGK